MKLRTWQFLALTVLLILPLSATLVAATEKQTASTVNPIMAQIGRAMEQLFPILFDDKKFAAPENEKKVTATIGHLQKLFKTAKPHFNSKSLTYRISFEVIDKQLSDAAAAMKYHNENYARNILKEFVSVCTSCHTQDSKLRTLFSGTSRSHFSNELQFAEFNYMTRNYPIAIQNYSKYLDKNKELSESELLTIMKRILTINVQIYNRPEDAIKQLEKIRNYPNHTSFSKKNLEEWLAGLHDLVQQKASKVKIKDFSQLKSQVYKILGELIEPGSAEFPSKKEKVARVWLRGLLYHYLNTSPPKDEIPEILYWLAIVDRSINYSFYYSLSDMYLKECMLQYTSHPFAKKCYDEYESYVTFSYSGSRGTDIPDDIQQELRALKVRVYTAPNR